MGSFGNIHNASGAIEISPSPWPEGIGSGGGSLTLKSNISYYISGVNSNLTISLDSSTYVYSDYEVRYNLVFEYVSGTVTLPSSIHWNVDWNTFTLDANTWYEIDIKKIGGNSPTMFGVIVKYEN